MGNGSMVPGTAAGSTTTAAGTAGMVYILYHNTILYDTRYNTVVVVCCGGKKLGRSKGREGKRESIRNREEEQLE